VRGGHSSHRNRPGPQSARYLIIRGLDDKLKSAPMVARAGRCQRAFGHNYFGGRHRERRSFFRSRRSAEKRRDFGAGSGAEHTYRPRVREDGFSNTKEHGIGSLTVMASDPRGTHWQVPGYLAGKQAEAAHETEETSSVVAVTAAYSPGEKKEKIRKGRGSTAPLRVPANPIRTITLMSGPRGSNATLADGKESSLRTGPEGRGSAVFTISSLRPPRYLAPGYPQAIPRWAAARADLTAEKLLSNPSATCLARKSGSCRC